MIDHYYGAYADMVREDSERINALNALREAQTNAVRRLEGEELAAAGESILRTGRTESSAVVTLAPPQPPPPPRPTEQLFEPLPGVMVREDIPAIEANPDLELRGKAGCHDQYLQYRSGAAPE